MHANLDVGGHDLVDLHVGADIGHDILHCSSGTPSPFDCRLSPASVLTVDKVTVEERVIGGFASV
jgi:hypothetical protein